MEYIELKPLIKPESIIEVKGITSLFIFDFKAGDGCDEQYHNTNELIFVADGEELVSDNGTTFEVKKNQIFIHKALVPHFDKCKSETSRLFVMTFDADSSYLDQIAGRPITLTPEQIALLKDMFGFGFANIEHDSGWIWFSKRYLSQELNPKIGAFQLLMNKIESFLIMLLNSNQTKKDENEIIDDPLIGDIIKVLEEEKLKPFSLDKIAERTNYSKSYLCRYFKEKVGQTINVYFYCLKLDEAKKLLIDKNYSIEQISILTGFDSVQYFSQVFKKYTGTSPSVWRSVNLS